MIKKMKIRNILVTSALCCSLSSAFAVENVVKLGAVVEVQAIHYDNNGAASQQKLSTHKKRYGFHSTGNFLLDYQMFSESGFKYGAKIGIEQTTKNNRGAPLAIYVESDYGKLELGSAQSAGQTMKLTGYKSSCATGNGWDAYIISSPTVNDVTTVPYVTSFCSFLDSKTRTSRLTDYSRKITYFTPKFGNEDHKIQVGISYIPDTSNAGHSKVDANSLHEPVTASDFKFAIKDGVSYGLTYEGSFNEDLSAKVAIVGERGKPVAFDKVALTKSGLKFKDLNTYVIGSEVTYSQVSVAGSYMNYNKSLTNSTIDTGGRNTGIYTFGAKYNFLTKHAVSLNHFHSNHKKNKVDATTLGADYFITDGIKAYAQFTYYKTKGLDIKSVPNVSDKSKGTIVILGSKISI
jgi:hypothetical protein